MGMYKEVKGNLFDLLTQFDVIAHGCNCFCVQGAGIAKEMAKRFWTDDPSVYTLEGKKHKGSYNKLGTIQYAFKENGLAVVNCYTQYHYGNKYGKPIDYVALRLCMRKINHKFKGQRIGLP